MKLSRVVYAFLLLLTFCSSFPIDGHTQVTETYCSTDVPVAIPGFGQAPDSVLNVPDVGQIQDVVVQLQIDHTFRSDLDVTLESPDNTTIILFDDVGGGGDDFGTTCDPMPNFLLDDGAADPVIDFEAGDPAAGTYSPEQPLSSFMNEEQSGQWTLSIFDDFAGDVGQLNCWCLEITRSVNVPQGCCVLGQASCLETTEAQCSADNGAYQGDDTSCDVIRQCFAPTLTPLTATNELLTDHTVTATYLLAGIPEEGVLVDFEIISGPNTGEMSDPDSGECTPNDNCTTDANGEVSWTYSSSDVGTDTIIASIDDGEIIESNTVEKTWIITRNIPTLSEWSMIALTVVLGVSAVLYLKLRRRRQSI